MGAIQNSAISAQYEPGSVLKVSHGRGAALDTGVVTPTEKVTDTGSIVVGDRIILNSSRTALGPGRHDRDARPLAQRGYDAVGTAAW